MKRAESPDTIVIGAGPSSPSVHAALESLKPEDQDRTGEARGREV